MLIAKTPAIGSFLSKNPKATTTNERQLVTLKASPPLLYTYFFSASPLFPWKKRFSGEIPRAMLAALELLNSFLLLHGWIHSPNPKLSWLWWLWKDVVKRESAIQWTNMPITYPSPSLLQPMLLVLLLSDDDDRVGLRHGRHRGHGHKSSRELFTASFSVLFLCHVGLLGYISWWWGQGGSTHLLFFFLFLSDQILIKISKSM